LKHVPLRRLLPWRRSAHDTLHAGEVEHPAGEAEEQSGSLRPHDLADLARAAATDREAIETKLGRRRRSKR